MPEIKHTLRVDFLGGYLVATCPCGQWKEQYPAVTRDRLRATFEVIDAAYAEHVAENGPPGGEQG
jgi:hypothetical protein